MDKWDALFQRMLTFRLVWMLDVGADVDGSMSKNERTNESVGVWRWWIVDSDVDERKSGGRRRNGNKTCRMGDIP